jgi:ketosteroid isomerase-like protein
MSISTMESRDSVRALDAAASYDSRLQAAERAVIEDFTEACRRGDANALCQWAGMTTDWALVKPPVLAGQILPRRALQLHEVMEQSLDYGDGPTMQEAMQLILNAANGMDCRSTAAGLVKRIGQTHAKYNTVVE